VKHKQATERSEVIARLPLQIPSPYEHIIEAIGSVVEQQSTKQVCHNWGFAERLNRQLSQGIPLLTEDGDCDLVGVHQLLASYTTVIVKLHFGQSVAIIPSTQEVLKQIQKNQN
jgi:predicted transcriptional regulator